MSILRFLDIGVLMNKSAARPYGATTLGMQQMLPIGERRQLSPKENADLESGESNWFPTIFHSYADKPSQMLASPGKQALLAALLGGGLGGVGGYFGGRALAGPGFDKQTAGAIGGGLGALSLGALAALIAYNSRAASNESVKDLVRRLPEGATRRDIDADPMRFYENNVAPYRHRYGGDLAPFEAGYALGDM